jgi:hypothetical protein
LQGQTPLTAGGPWTGSYSYTSENTPCATVSGSSTIAASSMPLLNGNFKSTGLLRQGGVVTPATVTVSLQQGGVVGTTLPYEDDVTGTILVQGSSCLTSGAIPSAGGGIIEGTDVQLEFVMNDGSILLLAGEINALDSTQFSVFISTTLSGSCGGGISFVPVTYPTYGGVYNTFTKQ